MVVKTNMGNAANQVSFDIGDDYGTDLIEISSHSGARPGCEPYQGNVYSRRGENKGYDAFNTTTYGQAAGILGINCGHVAYPFFEGLSTQTYRPTPSKRENDRVYAESQKQRYLERDIRAAKRKLSVAESTKDPEIKAKLTAQAKQRVKDKQANMRNFIDETKRTRRYAREQIPG
jgi:hypothetical protein